MSPPGSHHVVVNSVKLAFSNHRFYSAAISRAALVHKLRPQQIIRAVASAELEADIGAVDAAVDDSTAGVLNRQHVLSSSRRGSR